MKILATYNEINALIQKATGEDISLKRADSHTVSVDYTRRVGPFSPTLSINLTVEKVQNEVVACRYSSGKATEMLLNIAKPLLAKKGWDNIVQFANGNYLLVHLTHIEGAAALLQQITLHGISFEQDNIVVDFALK